MDDVATWLTQIWDERAAACQEAQEAMEAHGAFAASGDLELRWMLQLRRGGVFQTGWTMPGPPTPAEDLARIAADRQILALHHPDRHLENWYWLERECAECHHRWHKWLPDKPPTEIGPEQGCPHSPPARPAVCRPPRLPGSVEAVMWLWRKKAPAPRYVDAVGLMDWARRYAYEPLLDEKQRRAYQHMLNQIGRMEWKR